MKIRIKSSKLIMTLLVFAMMMTMLSSTAFAEEGLSIEIPIRITLNGSPPADDEGYIVVLEADNPDYPMPEGSENGTFNMLIQGEGTANMPSIKYSTIGIYTYTIYQLPGDNELTDYDDREYNLVVYITMAEDGSGLEATVLLFLIGEEGKQDEVVLVSNYEEEPEAPAPIPSEPQQPSQSPQTGDDTAIWPYVGLFISGASMIFILGMTIKKKKADNE